MCGILLFYKLIGLCGTIISVRPAFCVVPCAPLRRYASAQIVCCSSKVWSDRYQRIFYLLHTVQAVKFKSYGSNCDVLYAEDTTQEPKFHAKPTLVNQALNYNNESCIGDG